MNRKNGKIDGQAIVLLVGALIAFVVLLLFIEDVLSPFIAFAATVLFLWPIRNQPLVKYVLGVVCILFFIWFFIETRGVLTPFLLSLILAYLFNPLVSRLERYGFPRWLSSLMILLLVLSVVTTLMVFLLPEFVNQLGDLVDLSVKYSKIASGWIESEGIRFLTENLNINYEKVQEFILNQVPDKIQDIFQSLFKTALDVTTALSRLVNQIFNLVLVPILFFYLLKDFERIKGWIKGIIPRSSTTKIVRYIKEIDRVLGGFFRGQLIVCTLVGILTTGLLTLFGVRYALILGLIAGVLNIIPLVGLFITLGIGILIGLLSPSPLIACIKIVVIIEAIQILEGNILTPHIVGDRVGLHPVWILFSVFIFAHFWGFFGLLIAVPTTAILRIFVADGLLHYRNRNAPQAAGEEPPP